jgi:hypothetical protein
MNELQLKTAAHVQGWHMDACEWAVDQASGAISFTDHERTMTATAPVQIIGTFNTDDSSWLWGWANSSLHPSLVADANTLKAYGSQKGYKALTAPKVSCDEQAAWAFAALACMVCNRQGAYRGPAGSTMIFMTFDTVTLRKGSA